ncbi:hypothetical protein [Kitasatospora sp. NPDC059571]|uniref:hypothetical protein n=1 Tax=Kitasatospora sp. NPDC059571 TaxID=3346871 RepID=UPI0036B899F4
MSSETVQQSKAMELLAAIVAGDADIEDGLAQLRKEGVDSVETALMTLRQGLQNSRSGQAGAMQMLDIQRMQRKTPPDRVSRIVHAAPTVPFILNGTTYDPEDIKRFDGQELHFVLPPTQDHLLVVNDSDLIATWHQLLYLEKYCSAGGTTSARKAGTGGNSDTTRSVPYPRTWFFEDAGWLGYSIYLDANRGYYDLTKVSKFGPFGDWNDITSSVWLIGTHVAVLYSDIHWQGETLTLQILDSASELMIGDLVDWGFNDRASSLATW